VLNKVKNKIKQIRREIPECSGDVEALLILADFLVSKKRYHVLFEEYRQYGFYKLRNRAKREYITEYDVIHVMPGLFSDKELRKKLDDKSSFNAFFADFLGREYCLIDENNEEAFVRFIQDKKTFIVKPTDSWCGHGVAKVDVPVGDVGKRELYRKLISEYKKFLAEECFIQHEAIGRLNPDSVNTIRVISMIDKDGEVHVPFASIRIGRKGSAVDNFCAGGMAAAIDVDTGMIITHAFDGAGNNFFVHPDTGIRIIGFEIPEWKQLVQTVRDAAKRLGGIRFVGWDVVVRHDGKVCLIEGNSSPGARTLQLPLKKGLKPVYHKYLGKF